MKGLFIGIAGGSAAQLLAVIADAVQKAKHPGRLFFGVCVNEAFDPSPFFKAAGKAALRMLPGNGCNAKEAWKIVYGMLSEQAYALQLAPCVHFSKDWDASLIHAFLSAGAQDKLLTGVTFADGVSRTLAVKGFSADGGMLPAPGIKILHTPQPVPSMLIHPGFVFGQGEWMRLAREFSWDGASVLDLSVKAYSAGYAVFASHVPVFYDDQNAAFAPDFLKEELPVDVVQEFEQASGIRFALKKASESARLGIYTKDGRYPVQLSLAEGLRQYRKRRKEAAISRVMLSTALCAAEKEQANEIKWMMFQNMVECKRLSLTCYCLPESLKRLQKMLPNTYARKEVDGELPSFRNEDAFLRSKPHFIAEAAVQFPMHTHYGFIEMDYIKHPVYEGAVFLWDALTDDKIHLASVDGVIDPGLVIVPRSKVDWLVETADVLSPDPTIGPGDVALFKCLADTYPDAFTIHAMDRRHKLLSLCQPMISGGMLHDS